MSNYFRIAAECDRTIAATAPVPIYDIPPEEDDSEDEKIPTDITKMDVSDRTGIRLLPDGSTDKIRAQLDHVNSSALRTNTIRNAKILTKDAQREARTRRRLKDIEERNRQLIEELREERRKAKELEEETLKNQQQNRSVVEENHPLSAQVEYKGELVSQATESEAAANIDLFNRIRMEEERLARQHNSKKGIIGMYNDVALTHKLETEAELFPSQLQSIPGVHAKPAPDATGFVPEDVKSLLDSGKGQKASQEVLQRVTQFKAGLSSSHLAIRENERNETVEIEVKRKRGDAERRQMLVELVSQDLERARLQKEAKQARDAVKQRNITTTMASELSSVKGNESVSPSVAASGGLQRKRHPIDEYQARIRADMAIDVEELEHSPQKDPKAMYLF